MNILILFFACYELAYLCFCSTLNEVQLKFDQIKNQQRSINDLSKNDMFILILLSMLNGAYFIAAVIGLFTDDWGLWLALLFMGIIKSGTKKQFPTEIAIINNVDAALSFVLLTTYFIMTV